MPGIVVGVDNSTHSQRALDWAVNEAAIRKAPLTVVTVIQEIAGWYGVPLPNLADAPRAEQIGQAVRDQVAAAVARLHEPGPSSIEVRSLTGSPSQQILAVADDADMIVLGSRGTGGFAKLMLGSVSSQVTQHARCPVVIIPADDRS
ncbi:MAG TPA: universal stress protein [Streptosporangiaceae bacterium]|nr:universal stress protein [Streptosporangiaceae bacterium]